MQQAGSWKMHVSLVMGCNPPVSLSHDVIRVKVKIHKLLIALLVLSVDAQSLARETEQLASCFFFLIYNNTYTLRT